MVAHAFNHSTQKAEVMDLFVPGKSKILSEILPKKQNKNQQQIYVCV